MQQQVLPQAIKSILILLLLTIGIIVLFCFNPEQYVLMPKCFFKLLTGLDCPACGSQRAVHAALHGDFAKAVQYNYFLVFAGPYAILLALEQWILPKGTFQRRLKEQCEKPSIAYAYLAAFFIWFIIRNIYHI